jgi:alpha-1,6-mannosyltransferase
MAASASTRLLNHRPIHWWWRIPLLHHHAISANVFWLGVMILCVAWAGLGRRLRQLPEARPRDVVLVGAVWSLPLMLAPSLFSYDMYSYLAQGSLLAHGLSPYHYTPDYLFNWHDQRLFYTVSTTWRHTTSPYGPVFLAIAAGISTIAGQHMALGVTLMRLPEIAGLGLMAIYVPRLARTLGADPVRATWLAVISPLTLLYLVGGGHNDALMAGLLVAGVAYSLEDRPLAALALCALAAMIKLPAIAGIGIVGLVWLRQDLPNWRRVIASGGAVVVGLIVAAGLATGLGVSWISGSLFASLGAARVAITPATALGVSWHELLHGELFTGGSHYGIGHAAISVEKAMARCAAVATVLFAARLAWRARRETLVRYLGLILIAAAIGGPTAWPWYLSWGVVLLATDRVAQRSIWLPIVLVAAVFPVFVSGQVALALAAAPEMVLIYGLGLGVAVSSAWRRRGSRVRVGGTRVPLPHVPAAHHVSLPHVSTPPHVSLPHVPGVAHASHMTLRDPSAVASTEAAG